MHMMVGTPRCGIPGPCRAGMILASGASSKVRCAAARGAGRRSAPSLPHLVNLWQRSYERPDTNQFSRAHVSVRDQVADFDHRPRHLEAQQKPVALRVDHPRHLGNQPGGGAERVPALPGRAALRGGGSGKVFRHQRREDDWLCEIRPRAIHLRRTKGVSDQQADESDEAVRTAGKISGKKKLKSREPRPARFQSQIVAADVRRRYSTEFKWSLLTSAATKFIRRVARCGLNQTADSS